MNRLDEIIERIDIHYSHVVHSFKNGKGIPKETSDKVQEGLFEFKTLLNTMPRDEKMWAECVFMRKVLNISKFYNKATNDKSGIFFDNQKSSKPKKNSGRRRIQKS